MKVLVIEDSTKLQTSLGAGLRALGYQVDVVANSQQAIAYASDHEYDIIILDLMLPKDSSLLVLHEIRESNREVEILILSARDQIHDRVTALIQGANDYLVKPFSFDELHQRIQGLVQRKLDPAASGDSPDISTDASTRLNRMIQNLLSLCQCKHGEIELVISEVKLADLLGRVCLGLGKKVGQKDVTLRLPTQKLPKLLVDAKWMEHLLANLLSNAIRNSPVGAEINIRFLADSSYCALEIENQMSEPLCSDEVKTMFKNFCRRANDDETTDPIALLSLVKSHADCMNLGLDAVITAQSLLKIRLSNIKIV
jgi:DNA-binding response OmpR family regulator